MLLDHEQLRTANPFWPAALALRQRGANFEHAAEMVAAWAMGLKRHFLSSICPDRQFHIEGRSLVLFPAFHACKSQQIPPRCISLATQQLWVLGGACPLFSRAPTLPRGCFDRHRF